MDAASDDGTCEVAWGMGARVIAVPGSRAVAMNAGARDSSRRCLAVPSRRHDAAGGRGASMREALERLRRRRIPHPLRRWAPDPSRPGRSPSALPRACLRGSGDLRHASRVRPNRWLPAVGRSWRTTTSHSAFGAPAASCCCRSTSRRRPGATAARHPATLDPHVGDSMALPLRRQPEQAGANVPIRPLTACGRAAGLPRRPPRMTL